MESPVRAFARPVGHPRNLHETVVERKVVPERVLPALRVPPVVRELVADELVDVRQRQHLLGRAPDGHGCQRYVAVRRLLVAVRIATGSRHLAVVDRRFTIRFEDGVKSSENRTI